MAQPLQSINLVAPAFKGVNTEDSPIAQDQSYADVADNAVIDKRGRIASRKGVALETTTNTALGADYIHRIHYFYDDAGNTEVFSTGNNKIFSGTTTLTDISTAVGTSITGNDWKIVNFNDKAYFFQRGHRPLVYDNVSGLATFTANTAFYCNEAVAAYGRLWVVDSGTDTQTIYWSDLLIGTDFTGGSSGSINVSKAWPDGYDEVVALAAHNNSLIIFGNHSILIYGGAFSPATMALVDTISGVGCVDRNSVQSIGTDILFVSQSGLRSLGRTITEKSMPISDLSINVKTELIAEIENKTTPVATTYSPENSFYLLTFPATSTTYCFDLKGRLENGGFRVTRWTSAPFKSFERKTDGTLLVGTADGIGSYTGYVDQVLNGGVISNNTYRFRYYSPGLTFGDPSRIKILKKLRPTLVGANSALVTLYWDYDFNNNYSNASFTVGNQTPYYYNTTGSQFGTSPDPFGTTFVEAEFTGAVTTSRPPINATGNGSIITIGLETEINGVALSLQELNVLALIGKTL